MTEIQSVFFLRIDGITPRKMALSDLGQYMLDFVRLLGAEQCPRFYRIKQNCTSIGARLPREREVDTRQRLFLVRNGEGPQEALNAQSSIALRMGKSRAKGGVVTDYQGTRLIEIPVPVIAPAAPSLPVLTRAGSLQGQVIKIGGKQEVVPVQIEDVDGFVYYCLARRELARKLGRHIFGKTVRVHGVGKWRRDDERRWIVEDFQIHEVDEDLSDAPLDFAIERLRAIDSAWKDHPDPHDELERIRNGGAE